MMSPGQLATYGLSEDFAQHNLVIRSGNRTAASPATDGNDVIDSRIPFDSLSGGGGADVFIYGPESSWVTTITDFNPEEGDKINLSRLDADVDQPGHQSFTFSGQTPQPHSLFYDYVEYTGGHAVRVMGDRGGEGSGLEFLAVLSNVSTFDESALIL